MRQHSPPWVQVKAAGEVRMLERLQAVRAAGATRSGATRTASMLGETRRRLDEQISNPVEPPRDVTGA